MVRGWSGCRGPGSLIRPHQIDAGWHGPPPIACLATAIRPNDRPPIVSASGRRDDDAVRTGFRFVRGGWWCGRHGACHVLVGLVWNRLHHRCPCLDCLAVWTVIRSQHSCSTLEPLAPTVQSWVGENTWSIWHAVQSWAALTACTHHRGGYAPNSVSTRLQQAKGPSVRTAQDWELPVLTSMNSPTGGTPMPSSNRPAYDPCVVHNCNCRGY